MKPILLLFLLLFSTFSCTDGTEENYFKGDLISEHTFPMRVAIDAESLIILDSIKMGVSAISVIDSILMLTIDGRDYSAAFLNINDYSLEKYAFRIGNGPDEFATFEYLNQIYHYGKKLPQMIVNDINNWNIYSVDISKMLTDDEGYYRIITKRPSMFHMYGFLIDDNTITFNESNTLDKRVYQTFMDIRTDKIIKRIPLTNYNFDMPIGGQGQIMYAYSQSKGKLVMGCLFMNQIIIFDIERGKSKIFSKDKQLTKWEDILKKGQSNEERGYHALALTDDYIFAVNDVPGEKTPIHIFDWNGNPIMELELSVKIDDIAYDEKNNVMYGLNGRNEKIYKFDLTGVI